MRSQTWHSVGVLSTAGLAFVLAIVLGVAFGAWIDRTLDSSPIGFFAFFVIGLVAGVLNVYRISARYLRDTADERSQARSDAAPD